MERSILFASHSKCLAFRHPLCHNPFNSNSLRAIKNGRRPGNSRESAVGVFGALAQVGNLVFHIRGINPSGKTACGPRSSYIAAPLRSLPIYCAWIRDSRTESSAGKQKIGHVN